MIGRRTPPRSRKKRDPDPPPVIYARNAAEAWLLSVRYPTAIVLNAQHVLAWREKTFGGRS